MVLRVKKCRKYFGTRRWGAGNIKNHRGAGERGGVGKGGRKHKLTYLVKYDPESLHHPKGFFSYNKKKFTEINLTEISKRTANSKEPKPVIELRGYKVLGGGQMKKSVTVKAAGFTKSAEKKITEAGGEAVRL
ncbi:50S ribosomal protein L18e [uncultured archaeon]|nr:50S ribosomal protein L18e [uncultured archaeon]